MASVGHLLGIVSQCLPGAPLWLLSTIPLSCPHDTSPLLPARVLLSRKTPFCAQSIHFPSLSGNSLAGDAVCLEQQWLYPQKSFVITTDMDPQRSL